MAARATPPRVPLIAARFLPPTVGGRAVWFLPDAVRAARNVALYVCVVELFVSLGSLPFAAARTSLSRASSGIHGALTVVSLLGVVGAARLSPFAMMLHAVLAVGIPAVFALFMILTLTASQGVREAADAVVIVIFISLVWDVVAGVVSAVLLWRVNGYTAACKREDAELVLRVEAAVREQGRDAGGVGARAWAPMPAAVTGAGAGAAAGADAALAAAHRQARLAGLQEVAHGGGVLPPPNHGAAPPVAAPGASAPGGGGGQQGAAALDDGRCNLCVERRRDTALVPCGHMVCGECAVMVRQEWGRCHACRAPIAGVVRVYV
jgi:hypothetical protein